MARQDIEKRRQQTREASKRYRQRYPDKIAVNRKAAHDAGRLYLTGLKSVPCHDCGGTFHPAAMDFDHVRGEKRNDLSRMVDWPRDVVDEEVAKCDVVCANCHRIRTFVQNQYRWRDKT